MSADVPAVARGGRLEDAAAGVATLGTASSKAAASQLQAATEDDDLRAGLVGLSRLATGQIALEDALTRVAELAVVAVRGADGVGLTLTQARHADTIVASASFVAKLEAIQYSIDEGPSVIAATESRTVRSGSLESDPQWPSFGFRVGDLGVHSALSVPLRTTAGVLGAMNVYAYQHDAFDERAEAVGELFAVPASIAVRNAQVLAEAKRLAAQLQAALAYRSVIDQAMGIVMSEIGCTPEGASDRLRQISRGENQTLHSVALRVVDEAVRRGRAQAGNC